MAHLSFSGIHWHRTRTHHLSHLLRGHCNDWLPLFFQLLRNSSAFGAMHHLSRDRLIFLGFLLRTSTYWTNEVLSWSFSRQLSCSRCSKTLQPTHGAANCPEPTWKQIFRRVRLSLILLQPNTSTNAHPSLTSPLILHGFLTRLVPISKCNCFFFGVWFGSTDNWYSVLYHIIFVTWILEVQQTKWFDRVSIVAVDAENRSLSLSLSV